ncbi:ArsR/SmtB family transcription factor [Hugenholtzia roseola]|uniref:ArsR/SmtB family transcription factor n=1 Tax=Hugenholtzia roseola TaxID=1002 RepID=UPI000415554F|nr:metalloregulator ArsR/SmtB family transcription factor [Hugenholtzia roseola]
MGSRKTELFTEQENELAELLKVLSHPARLKIISYLLKVKTCIGNDIVEEIGMAQPTISQHLKELKRLKIIQGTIEGTSICYCIDPKGWSAFQEKVLLFFNQNPNQDAHQEGACCI